MSAATDWSNPPEVGASAAGTQPGAAPAVALPVWPAAFLTMALLAAVAMTEVDRLVADVLDKSGASWSFSGLFGPGRAFNPGGEHVTWDAWRDAGKFSQISGFLGIYVVFDLLFVLALVGAVFCLACPRRSRPRVDRQDGAGSVRLLLRRLQAGMASTAVHIVLVLAAVEVAESLGAFGVLNGKVDGRWLGWVTLVKWQLYAALIWAVGRRAVTADTRAQLRRTGYALVRQRFSLLALVPIAALGIASGPNLLDQLPDIERRWLDGGMGWAHLVWASIALVLLAGALFVLGRLRSDRIWRRATEEGPALKNATPAPWILLALALLVITGIVRAAGGMVAWRWVLFLAMVALCAPAASAFVTWRWGSRLHPATWQQEKDRVATIIRVGDMLAILALVLGGVGLVRACTQPAVLAEPSPVWPRVWLGIGFVTAVAAWPVAGAFLGWIDARAGRSSASWAKVIKPGLPLPEDVAPRAARIAVRTGLGITGVWLLAVLGTVPEWAAANIGAIACLVLAITGLVTVLGIVVVISQEYEPQPLFRLLHLRTTPVVTMLLVAAIVSWYQSGDYTLHGIRDLGTAAGKDPRPTLATAFTEWMRAAQPCDHMVPVGNTSRMVLVRPMVLVAAQGGGIRAAYWTASALEKITQGAKGSCGPQGVFLSSGVSGGSVGLGVLATSSKLGDKPVDAVQKLSAPNALGAAALGMLVRDDIAELTGIRLPTLDHTGGPGWHDRAALMEAIWEHQVPGLHTPFVGSGRTAAGWMIFNSTSVGTGCRVLVSQVHLDIPPVDNYALTKPVDPSCRTGATVLPVTFDLLADYSYQSAPGPGDHCVRGLEMVTAAMLSARFPYVTPSGVVGPCGDLSTQQLVDGGYAEGSGLGTLIDLAPSWLAQVRAANAAAVTALGQSPAANPPVLVAPIIVMLQNSFGSDITPSTSKLTTEIQVPLRGRQAAAAQNDTGTLLQRAAQLTSPAGLCEPADAVLCGIATEAIKKAVPSPIVLVAPDTRPVITAPLGWALSSASRDTLDKALGQQAGEACSPARQPTAACRAGYGRLADLLTETHSQ